MRQNAKRGILDFLCFFTGSALYAGALTLFIRPNGLVTGGFTGLSLIVNSLSGFPVGAMMVLFNLPLFLLGRCRLGKGFVLKSCFATTLAAIFTDTAAAILTPVHCDKILAAVAGGILCGSGLSLVLLRGGSTGGADIIGKLLHAKWVHLPVGRVIMGVDLAVIALSVPVYGKVENALYSAIMIALSAATVDYFLYGSRRGKLLLVVTEKGKAISEQVNYPGNRGATIVPVIGAFTRHEKAMLIIALKTPETGKIYNIIRKNDPNAFVTLLDAREVIGRGFEQEYE